MAVCRRTARSTVGWHPVMRVAIRRRLAASAGAASTSSCAEQLARRRAVVRLLSARQWSIAGLERRRDGGIDRSAASAAAPRRAAGRSRTSRRPRRAGAGRRPVERDARGSRCRRGHRAASPVPARAQILGRADDHVGAGLVRVAGQRAGDAEVGDHGVAVASNRMLSTLMSRWMTPSRWAKPRARATSIADPDDELLGKDVASPRAGRPGPTGGSPWRSRPRRPRGRPRRS